MNIFNFCTHHRMAYDQKMTPQTNFVLVKIDVGSKVWHTYPLASKEEFLSLANDWVSDLDPIFPEESTRSLQVWLCVDVNGEVSLERGSFD